MTNKLTNKKALQIALSLCSEKVCNNGTETLFLEGVPYPMEEVMGKLESMAAALENKSNSATRKPTEKQKENIALREKILEFLRANPVRLVTCTEIGKEVPELNGMNNQRISALMRALVDAEAVTKITEKGKSVFQLTKKKEGAGE